MLYSTRVFEEKNHSILIICRFLYSIFPIRLVPFLGFLTEKYTQIYLWTKFSRDLTASLNFQIIFMKDCHVKATGNLSEVCKAASEEVCKWGMLSSFSSSSIGQSSGINSFQGLENAKLTRLKSRSYRQISNNRNQQLWSPENSVI